MNSTKVLQIVNDYAGSTAYSELITKLSETNSIEQNVVSVVRSDWELEYNRPKLPRVNFSVLRALKPYHRLFFRNKIKIMFEYIEKENLCEGVSIMHAHMLYSDGAVADKLYKKYNIPFIVAVRNTDINFFNKYRPDLSFVRDQVLVDASRIVFTSPAYLQKLLLSVPKKFHAMIIDKSIMLGNGVASFWLENKPASFREHVLPLNILYVGNFTRNKNISGLLKAVERVSKAIDVAVNIVGGTASDALDSGIYIPSSLNVKFHGRIVDRSALLEIYRANDIYAMPSFSETFGLSYIEALSQGLPVIHSIGEGIDGFFPTNTVTEAVDPHSSICIAKGIRNLHDRLMDIRRDCVSAANQFNWSSIANVYSRVYSEIIESST